MKKFKDIRSFFQTNTLRTREDNTEVDATRPSIPTSDQSSTNSIRGSCLDEKQEVEGTKVSENSLVCSPASTSQSVDSAVVNSDKPDELGTLQDGPSQPVTDFPKTKFGTKFRSFSSRYYESYNSWLEYSKEEDKVYCFVCRHFNKANIRDQNEKFVKSGFNNWKKLAEALKKHSESSSHAECSQLYVSYRQSLTVGDVHQQLMKQQEEEIVQNREYLVKLIDIILTLVRQGLPLRGHREAPSSKNRGNFLEIAQFFAKYDDKFSLHFEKHYNYCSPDIQNEIIEVISNLTLEEIVKEAKACGFFSLSVDEARSFKEEQLSITIRYADGLDIVERFIGFINCSTSRDAQGLATLILNTLNKDHLGDVPILAQSYDGASVMSGKNRGLQAIIKETHPHAIYIHCLAHKLNLVVVNSCANVSLAKTFFNGLEALYVHFSQPGHHASLKKLQGTLGINTNREMGSLSTTRWNCRFENCKAVLINYEAIKLVLEKEVTENQDKHTVEALGLLTIITKPEFVVSLHTFHAVLAIVNVLSKFFQTQNATLGQASELITSTIATFEACRNQFKIWTDIEQFAQKQEISLEPVRVSKKRRQQKDFYTESTVGKSNTLDLPADTQPEEYWKINIYYQVVDNIIVNLKRRFENLPLARAVDAFLKLDMKNAEDFINNYRKVLIIDTSALEAEAMVMKNMLQLKNDEVNAENLRKHIKKEYCPNLYKLFQAAIVLPVSSAGCERSFSAMRRIKTWLRSTMLQERFSHVSLLNIENDIVKRKIPAEKVLSRFAERNRKLRLI